MPIENLQSFRFEAGHRFLIDANVWLFAFGPFPKPPRSGIYDDALRDIRIKKSLIHLNAFILSEFMNAYARIEYRNWIKKNYRDVPEEKRPIFKKFRDHEDFKPIADEIRIAVKGILQTAIEYGNPEFSQGKANEYLDEYGKVCADFNDQILADVCETGDYILLTDDGDFKNFDSVTNRLK